ncbi:MAG: hypothetical protein ACFFFT_08105 [Candidatus Thorarchaeota archaeon]
MDKIQSTFQLLALVSIFFIYRTIMGILNGNSDEVVIWSLITIVYIISLIVAYIVLMRWRKEQNA